MSYTAPHAPILILSPDGCGVRTTVGCACGQRPTVGAAQRSTMQRWITAHYRRLGLDYSAAPAPVYGPEYPAAGQTPNRWYDHSPELDPFTGRSRFADLG